MAYAASQVAIFTEPDDYVLENNADVIYVHVLDRFDFNLFQGEEQQYYEALADFNRKLIEKQQASQSQHDSKSESESQQDTYQRLLFDMLEQEPSEDTVLVEIPAIGFVDANDVHHNPKDAGRKPKDFYALTKAFLGVSYMGLQNSPAIVYSQLINNPSFARKCGFKYIIDEQTKQCQHNIPSLRKLEQFEQIMNLY